MATAWLLALSLAAADPVAADLVLRGGTVYDGSNTEGAIGDVAIKGDRIVAVGKFEVAGSPRIIDCKGLIVAPGFIDLHSHSDSGIVQPKTRQNANFLMQGCTTVVTGNCGSGPIDVAAYLQEDRCRRRGHEHPASAAARQPAQSRDARRHNRPPSPDELTKMQELAERGDARRRLRHGDGTDLYARIVFEDRRAGRDCRGRRPSTAAFMRRIFATKARSFWSRSTRF